MQRKRWPVSISLTCGLILLAGWASASSLSLTNNQRISGSAPVIAGLSEGTPASIPGTGSSPNWFYSWTSAGLSGLELGAFKLYCHQDDHSPRGTIVLDQGGGDLKGLDSSELSTWAGIQQRNAHNLTVTNVGDVAIGGVDTRVTSFSGTAQFTVSPGSFTLGQPHAPAGNVRIGYVHCQVDRTSAEIRSNGGTVALYGTGYVHIADSGGTRGDIRTHNEVYWGGGAITVIHQGEFLAGTLNSSGGGWNSARPAGNILLDGGDASGDLEAGAISASYKARSGAGPSTRATVEMRNYDNVVLGPIDGYNVHTGNTPATDVIVTNNIPGDITISGSINLRAANTPTFSGELRLKAGGTVTLAELDLGRVFFAALDSGSGPSLIKGALKEFATSGSGEGTETDPVQTTQTALRAPLGQTVYYKAGENPTLGGMHYTLANWNGEQNAGGVLAPEPGPPAVRTDPAANIGLDSADLQGALISTGIAATAVSVYWSEGTDPAEWSHTNHFGVYSPAMGELPLAYSFNATGLTPGTPYAYSYYATNDAGEVWGAVETFTTLQASAVANADATEISWTTVRAHGEVTSGVPTPTAFFCLAAGSDPGETTDEESWDRIVAMGPQSGSFDLVLFDLTPGTDYTLRVYAENGVGDPAWSAALQFTTVSAVPDPLVLDVDRQIDAEDPFISFEGTPARLYALETGADRLFDLSLTGSATPVDFNLSSNMLYCADQDNTVQGTIVLDLHGGNLLGKDGLALRTWPGVGNRPGLHLTITNVGDVAIGGVDTRATASSTETVHRPGNFTLGRQDAPAGDVRIEYVHCYADHTGAELRVIGGDATIFGSGAVRIMDSLGVRGDIRTHNLGRVGGGAVRVEHAGEFVARYVNTATMGWNTTHPAGDIALDGGDASGDLTVEKIEAWLGRTSGMLWEDPAKCQVTVARYRHVTIGGILGYNANTANARNATDVTITNGIAGNIEIPGEIDLECRGGTASRSGALRLAAGGTVTLGDLHLDKVRYASFSGQGGVSRITGVLDGFATAGSGAGTLGDPVVTTQTRLRTPNGQRIYYAPAANPGLEEKVYRIADQNGTPEAGGLLMPEPASGTVIRFR